MPPLMRPTAEDDVRVLVLIIMGFSAIVFCLGVLYFSLHPLPPTPGL